MSDTSWGGCLEARPNGYEETDDAPSRHARYAVRAVLRAGRSGQLSAYSGYTTYLTDGVTGNQDTRLKRSAKVHRTKTRPIRNKDCNLQKIQPLTNNKSRSGPGQRHDHDRQHARRHRRGLGLAHAVADGALHRRLAVRRRRTGRRRWCS